MIKLTKINRSTAWKQLQSHAKLFETKNLITLFQENPQRFNEFSLEFDQILIDFSKNWITSDTVQLLLKLPQAVQLKQKIEELFSGEKINQTEDRPALHTALRNQDQFGDNYEIYQAVNESLQKMFQFVEDIHDQKYLGYGGEVITDAINIGIGGSDLGSVLCTEALKSFDQNKVKVHFISNVEGEGIADLLLNLDFRKTIFIVSSKSFTTQETLINAQTIKKWFIAQLEKIFIDSPEEQNKIIKRHFVGISANQQKVLEFGIDEKLFFNIWDWVGGRYSLWSNIGLPIVLSIGVENFKQLLQGASSMDHHFRTAEFKQNLPVMLGLISIWYNNFFNAQSYAVLPYSQRLRRLPAYLQQLEMESNGKSVNIYNEPISYQTSPIIWGEVGMNGQHAFFQLLHQGKRLVPIEFLAILQPSLICPKNSSHDFINQAIKDHHEILIANCFAQSEALMRGQPDQSLPHKHFTGNKPSTTILMKTLSPYSLGQLLALYEHKVYVQSVIWQINAFDQWGVELGKKLTQEILPKIQEGLNNPAKITVGKAKDLVEYFTKYLISRRKK